MVQRQFISTCSHVASTPYYLSTVIPVRLSLFLVKTKNPTLALVKMVIMHVYHPLSVRRESRLEMNEVESINADQ